MAAPRNWTEFFELVFNGGLGLPIASDLTLDPTNLATGAKQDTGNTSLASLIDKATAASTITDHSGTVTSGGTAQELMGATAGRRWFFIQNISDTDCWINFGTTAVADQPSMKIVAGGAYENPPHFCPVGTISIIGATTGKKFVCKEGV